jgi:AraC family transcriptional activator of pobA
MSKPQAIGDGNAFFSKSIVFFRGIGVIFDPGPGVKIVPALAQELGKTGSSMSVRIGWTVVASRLETALAHRLWSIRRTDGEARCHAFLIRHGHAVLSTADERDIELTGPTLVWLPLAATAEFRLLAGSDGATFSAAEEFAWRTVGESPVGMQLRPLLGKTLIAAPDRIAPHLDELTMSFEVLIRESCTQQSGASAMMSANLALILLHLWRASGLAERTGMPRGAGTTTIQRFRQLVELYYREGLKIDDYANMLGVTRSHLHEACVRLSQRTPLAMIHDRLIEEARLRLEQTALSVEQIGYGLGFRDAGYFNRFFKRLTGQSPGAFRQAAITAQPRSGAPSFAAWP